MPGECNVSLFQCIFVAIEKKHQQKHFRGDISV